MCKNNDSEYIFEFYENTVIFTYHFMIILIKVFNTSALKQLITAFIFTY